LQANGPLPWYLELGRSVQRDLAHHLGLVFV
jgi:hypothetical protein